MKNIYVIIFFLLSFNAFATNYYVSNSGNDSNNGATEATAWKTLAKVNSYMNSFVPGDVISFKGGDQFYGTLNISNKNNLTFTSYGNGKAIITGSKEITSWKKVNGNIWEADVKNITIFQVFKNKLVQQQARYPKIVGNYATSDNYYTINSIQNSSTFTSKSLIGFPDIAGAYAQILTVDWRLESIRIKAFNSSTGQVTLASAPPVYAIRAKSIFFVIGGFNLLDAEGEWHFESSTNKLFVYSVSVPTNIMATTSNTNGITLTNCNSIKLSNLTITRFNLKGITTISSSNIDIKNCLVSFSNDMNIGSDSKSYAVNILDSEIIGSQEIGIESRASNSLINNNLIRENGIMKVITSRYNTRLSGIYSYGKSTIISNNTINDTGLNSIRIFGEDNIVEKNLIQDFCLTIHDGTGIDTWNNSFEGNAGKNLIIDKNIILNNKISDNIHWYDFPIYLDDFSHDITVSNNTTSGGVQSLYLHNTRNITVENNRFYRGSAGGIQIKEDKGAGTIKNNIFLNNDIFSANTKEPPYRTRSTRSTSFDHGTSNYNKYFNPSLSESVKYQPSTSVIHHTLAKWRTFSNQDANSVEDSLDWSVKESYERSQLVYNETNIEKIIILSGVWQDLDGIRFNGSITLPAFASKILLLSEDQTGSINANAGVDVSVCSGDSTTLNATGGSSYVWSSGETTASITVSPTVTTTYSVIVSDGSGNSASDEVIVTVNSVIANAGSDVTINEGDNTVLTAGGGETYLWSTGETTKSITVSPTSTQTYTVTAYKNGCENTDNITVTVNPKTGSINANAGSDTEICLGDSTTLTASGGSSYSWSTGETSESIIVNPDVTTTYSVTVSDGANSASDEVIVTVNSVIANAGPDVTINEGNNTVLTASGGDTYLWSTGATNKNITVSPTSTKTYTVTVSENGCTESDDVIVNVNPKTGSITANAGSDTEICLGDSTTLTASGGSSYSWSTGETSESIIVNPDVTSTYSVTVSDGTYSASDEVIVTVNSVIANAGSDVTINEGDSITLKAIGGDSYLWNTGETTQSITVSPKSNQEYTVTVKLNGCEGSDSVLVSVNSIVISNPLPSSANAGEDATICLGQSINLIGSGGDTYQWSTEENTKEIKITPTRTSTFVLYATRGGVTSSDTVTITVENCEQSGDKEDENLSLLGLKVYPNPTQGVLYINIDNLEEDTNLIINDSKGSTIYSEMLSNQAENYNRNLDLSRYSTGVYFVRLWNSEQSLNKTVIVQ